MQIKRVAGYAYGFIVNIPYFLALISMLPATVVLAVYGWRIEVIKVRK